MAEDPFPRERVGATLRRMPAYLKLSWRLARDPLLSRARRAAVIAAAGYLASPIDLVPGVIPVVGQLDDIAFAIAALKLALSGLDPVRRREHLQSVGLGDDDLAEDLRTAVVASAWLVRAGVRDDGQSGEAGRQGGRGRRQGSGDRRQGGRDRCRRWPAGRPRRRPRRQRRRHRRQRPRPGALPRRPDRRRRARPPRPARQRRARRAGAWPPPAARRRGAPPRRSGCRCAVRLPSDPVRTPRTTCSPSSPT